MRILKFFLGHVPVVLLALSPLQGSAVPFKGSQMVVASESKFATETAEETIAKGGNVVDVAVSIALTLAVTCPYNASFGGGGFAQIKLNGSTQVLDFRETAPAASRPDMYMNKPGEMSKTGGLAIAVPGVPMGLWEMHKRYGKLHWSRLFDHPIALAEKGFRVTGEWVEEVQENQKRFNGGGKKLFFKKDGSVYEPGSLFKQPGMAKVLKEMRNRNVVPFYSGLVANDIVSAVKSSGGVITLQDMKNYKVRWLSPLVTQFSGYKLYLMPPPSSGGVVLKTALKLVEDVDLKKYPELGADEAHLLVEVQRRAFRSRMLLGDPDFTKNPLERILSSTFIDDLAKSIDLKKVSKLDPLPTSKEESKETTHFSVMDAAGNAVAFTLTANGGFGSAVVSEQFGIVLNNEMDDFTTQPNVPNQFGLIQGPANDIQPNKRPLSSMSPTIVEKDGKTVLVLGAPGGPRIISAVLQTLYRNLIRGRDLDLAIQSPRVHHQFQPDVVYYDRSRWSGEVVEALRARGHKLMEADYTGKVFAVGRSSDGFLEGAFDSRGEGSAGGL